MNFNHKKMDKFEQYNYLMETYITTLIQLIDTSYSMKILPLKIMFGLGWIKKYIQENTFDVLQNGVDYLLTNKDIILNFDVENLNVLDEDFDDNVSVKSCINNIKQNQHLIQTNINISDSNDMLNLIIEIKNNTKKLCSSDIAIIKSFFELLIIILEKIQKIFD